MKKSYLLFAFVIGAVLAAGVLSVQEPAGSDLPAVTVYKSPTCGCCSKWVEHLEQNDFPVKAVDTQDLAAMKERYGIPRDLSACHTAVVGGYLVEGHVPAEEIQRLLTEEAEVAGLAVPGMPVGSPGMEGDRVEPYDIIAFRKDGSRSVYASR